MSDVTQPLPPIEEVLWNEKYRYLYTDETIEDTNKRVMNALFLHDPKCEQYMPMGLDLMNRDIFVPGGRILAGAGTDRAVTLINCYVNDTIADSMKDLGPDQPGIMTCLAYAAYTMQMGGGIGTDFSSLRPRGAIVKRTGSITSGVIPFMNMWDAMCLTIKSGGTRRGAMMATLACWHPDIIEFIKAKHKKDTLVNFNVSVMITDDFMAAVEKDDDWNLSFPAPAKHTKRYVIKNGKRRYIYKTIKARELWDMILESTYEYAEPGVVFIDRINKTNNLYYCETINCLNPCGEQPLPKHGACNLGCLNLSRLVLDPFTNDARIDWDTLRQAAYFGIRFLDNVLDVTQYPLEQQHLEAMNKRRTGLGIMGLGNAFQMLKVRYGSAKSVDIAEDIMRTIRDSAYQCSIDLAKERGAFPLFNRDDILDAEFIKMLPEAMRNDIARYGLRTGVSLTIAPTGNTSVFKKNVSGSAEPPFDFEFVRTMLCHDDVRRDFPCVDYGYAMYKALGLDTKNLPDYMVTAHDITVEEHVAIQAALQKYVDAAISKTINCPPEMTFEDFKHVYMLAYNTGCKGCTTYRPSDVRGSVLKKGKQCPSCHERTIIREDNCQKCTSCFWSVCDV